MTWQSVESSLAFMLISMPLFGAALVGIARMIGDEVVRMATVTNAAISLIVVLTMCVLYQPNALQSTSARASADKTSKLETRTVQFQSHLRWIGQRRVSTVEFQSDGKTERRRVARTHGPKISFSVGVDGISLMFLLLVNLLVVVCVLAGCQQKRFESSSFYVWLLLLQAGANGVLVSLDVVLFYVFMEWAIIPAVLLLGWFGDSQRRHSLTRFLAANVGGSLFILFGLVGVVVSYSMMRSGQTSIPRSVFSIETLTIGISRWATASERALEYWQLIGPWLLISFLVGFGIKIALVPLHSWWRESSEQANPLVSILLNGLFVQLSLYGMIRFVIPLFPEFCLQLQSILVPVLIVGMSICALRVFTDSNWSTALVSVSLAHISLAVLAILSFTAMGIMGAIIGSVGHTLAVSMAFLMNSVEENQTDSGDESEKSADVRPFNRILNRTVLLLPLLSLMGIPFLANFTGRWMMLAGIFDFTPRLSQDGMTYVVFAMVPSMLVAVALFRRLWAADFTKVQATWNVQQAAAVLLIAVALLACGLIPQAFVDTTEPSVNKALESYELFVERLIQQSPEVTESN